MHAAGRRGHRARWRYRAGYTLAGAWRLRYRHVHGHGHVVRGVHRWSCKFVVHRWRQHVRCAAWHGDVLHRLLGIPHGRRHGTHRHRRLVDAMRRRVWLAGGRHAPGAIGRVPWLRRRGRTVRVIRTGRRRTTTICTGRHGWWIVWVSWQTYQESPRTASSRHRGCKAVRDKLGPAMWGRVEVSAEPMRKATAAAVCVLSLARDVCDSYPPDCVFGAGGAQVPAH